MKILTSLAVMAFAGSLSAQTTYLSEDFNGGVVPPAGWTMVNNNGNTGSAGWISSGDRAWHEDEFNGQSDNRLISPAFVITTPDAFLHFDGETNWAQWLANHPSSIGNGISTMEINVNGGGWIIVWIDTSLNNGDTYSPTVDLGVAIGDSVQIGVHFSGDFAQEWWVDNVVVDDQSGAGGGLVYSITNLVAGATANFSVTGASAGGAVILGYSLAGAGPTATPYGLVDMSAPITTLATLTADGSGNASFSPTVPGGAAGATLYTQGVDLGSGTLTNSLAELVL
ncbi:MAG: hypothetical protein COA70_06690 [Planctomycetota bacterium]|nr:MAG: hypothetical protein COA70_06690 [Planctomycetota bacterium]